MRRGKAAAGMGRKLLRYGGKLRWEIGRRKLSCDIEGKLSCDGEKAAKKKFLPRDNLLSLSLSFYIKQIFTGVSSRGGGLLSSFHGQRSPLRKASP